MSRRTSPPRLDGMSTRPRRVVTGHTADGVSVVRLRRAGAGQPRAPRRRRRVPRDLEHRGRTGADRRREEIEPTERDLAVPPPPHGTKIRINEFQPGHLDERGLQSPVHRTASVDYGIVLEGEITLVLDDSEVTLRAGDVVVQRGTDHAWANRGDAVARVGVRARRRRVHARPAGDAARRRVRPGQPEGASGLNGGATPQPHRGTGACSTGLGAGLRVAERQPGAPLDVPHERRPELRVVGQPGVVRGQAHQRGEPEPLVRR